MHQPSFQIHFSVVSVSGKLPKMKELGGKKGKGHEKREPAFMTPSKKKGPSFSLREGAFLTKH